MKTNDEDIIVKIDRHIEVVTAETTGMKETGLGSVETCRRVRDVLQSRYATVHFNDVQSERDLQRIVDREPDLVVLCVKYVVGEERDAKIWLQDYFSRHDVPHTGSSRATLEFDSNKSKAKTVLLEKGVATAKFFLAQPGLFKTERHLRLPLPLFVKPLDAANGNGIDENSLVHDFASYEAKVVEIFTTYGNRALVEEVLPGREFTVAVLDDSGTTWWGPIRISPDSAGASRRAKSVAHGGQTNPNTVSGIHLAPFAVKNVSPAAAANPLEARMR